MSKVELLFFSKENTGGTIGFFSKIFPDLQHYFELKIFFFKKVNEGFFIDGSNFLSKTYTPGMSMSFEKFGQTYHNLIKITKRISSIKEDSIIVVLDIYTYILVCFSVILMVKKNKIIYIVENNIPEVLHNNRSSVYRTLLQFSYKLLIARVSGFVFTSNALARDFKRGYGIKSARVNVIPLGVDIGKINELKYGMPELDAKLFDGVTGIVTVMNFTPQKDIGTIIEAFAQVQKDYPRLRLFVIGSGYGHAPFKEKLKELKIEDKVHFLGWKKNVTRYLLKCKIFVFSSKYEGFGLAILEAMSLGLPVISSDTKYGPADLLGNQKYGLLYPVGNVKKLSEEIRLLLTDSRLAKEYSTLGIRRSFDYDMPKIVKKYRDFFSSL